MSKEVKRDPVEQNTSEHLIFFVDCGVCMNQQSARLASNDRPACPCSPASSPVRACVVDAKQRFGGIASPDVVRNIVDPARAAERALGIVHRPVLAGVTFSAYKLTMRELNIGQPARSDGASCPPAAPSRRRTNRAARSYHAGQDAPRRRG